MYYKQLKYMININFYHIIITVFLHYIDKICGVEHAMTNTTPSNNHIKSPFKQ